MELLNAYDDASNSMKQKSRRILWSMDEAGRIGISNLPEHASTVNGRNISLSMSAQDRSQFNAVYGRDRTKNLFTNIRTQLVFCQADFETAKLYSDRTGETSGYAHSESEHGGETTSTGKSERGISVMSPQDFMEMDDGELVCFIGKKKPFRLKSMDWRRHPQLKHRLKIKPPALAPLPPLAESQPEQPPAKKTTPLSAWHFDPQLFRKWPPFLAISREESKNHREHEEGNEVSLRL
jgi:type IV secretory pathway TraG/TraD family ATPase VirD4